MPVATCPCREELIDYVVGKLSDQASDGLASHLDACPQCQAELASLPDPDDTLIARLRGTAQSDPFQDEPGCDRAVARALAVAESNGSAADLPRQLGEYQLLQRLGSGGMGTVYKARQGRLDRVVALKILSRGRTDDPRAIIRFEREMKAIGRLDHPNIVRAYDAREIDGTPVLIMEFVDGLDLAEIVRRCGAGCQPVKQIGNLLHGLPVPDACELVRRTALALQCAHDHGLVHRDIKPSNIMLARSGEVKLLDLGLARFFAESGGDVSSTSHVEETTGTGQAMGTADYMAPEQASDSRTVDIRADIYSLGCTLYKLLSGRAPFSGPEYCATLDKMNAHVQKLPPPIRQFAPDVPERLAAVVDRMLAKNPGDRFNTPAEVVEAIAPFCAGADLPALLTRAFAAPPSDLQERQQGQQRADTATPGGKSKSAPMLLTSFGWKWFAGQLLLLLMAGGLGFALGIIIRIKKDGQTTTVDVPAGSKASVAADGQVDVELAGRAKGNGNNAKIDMTRNTGKPIRPLAAASLPVVKVTQPVVCNVCDYEEYTGRIEDGVVQIRNPITRSVPIPGGIARVSRGSVEKVYFGEGATVREGDLLAEMIDEDDPKLKQAREALRLAESHRNEAYAKKLPESAKEHAKRLSEPEAAVKSAQEELDRTRRNVPRVKILAPISGKLGDSGFGGFGGRGGGGPDLPSAIISPDSMLVTFDIPESAVLAHRRLPDRKPNWELSLPVVVALADDKGFPYRGKVVSVAEGIDPKTHTQRWQAIVPNKNGLFMPGMSVRVRVITSEPHKVMLVLWGGDMSGFDGHVFLVNDRNIAEGRKVKVGRRYDDYVAIIDGLTVNDWIIASTESSIVFQTGTEVKPDRVTTPPPPWASVDLTPPAAPPAVSVVHPIVRDVTDYQQFRGIIVAARSAEIRARVTGNLLKVHVKPGMAVTQGDLLFEIDPRLYQSEADQTASAVKEAQVRLDQRTKELKRFEQLLKNAAVSQDEYDRVKSQCEEAAAAIKTAEAAMTTARLRLDFTKVTAPFNGKITGGLLDEGNLVTADVTQLTTILSTDPVSVEFVMPATILAKIRGNSHGGPDPALSLPVFCRLTGDKGYDCRAKMDSIESRVEAGGGVMCRAVLANKEDRFAPGMTVDVRVAIGGPHKALLVPERSLHNDQVRRFVFVVNDRNVAVWRGVEIGDLQDGGLRVITDGVTAEDWVVTSGVQKLQPGVTVTPEKAAPAGK